MKIIEIKILSGPNLWSVNRPNLVEMKLDIDEFESLPNNLIDGFNERLNKLIPSFYSNRCSEGSKGRFLRRLIKGTWMGHIIEHFALKPQGLAGMERGFGRTRSTGNFGEYYVVFSYDLPRAGVVAAKSAVRLVESLANAGPFDLETCVAELRAITAVEAAKARDIPWRRLDEGSFIQFGYGAHLRRIRATLADSTSNIGVEVVQDEFLAKKILQVAPTAEIGK